MYKRKIITFDLDTIVAEQIFGKGYTDIYRKFGKDLHSIGLSRIEGSVYQSDFPISDTDLIDQVTKIIKKNPKISQCIREIHYGDVPKFNSLNDLTKYDGTPGKYAKKKLIERIYRKNYFLPTKIKMLNSKKMSWNYNVVK